MAEERQNPIDLPEEGQFTPEQESAQDQLVQQRLEERRQNLASTFEPNTTTEDQLAQFRALASGNSKSSQKQAELSQKRGSKQQQVKERSNQIELELDPTMAALKEIRDYANTAENRLRRDDRTRSLTEFGSDAAIAAGRGAVRLGQSALGAALPDAEVDDVLENPYFQRAQAALAEQGRETQTREDLVQQRQEERNTILTALKDAETLVDDFNNTQSEPIQARRFANQEELEAYREERKAEIGDRELSGTEKAKEVAGEFFNTVAAYASRPSLAIDLAFENVADIFLTGGIGKALAVPREIAEQGAESVAKWAATEAGQKELKKRATALGVTTTAVQEGLGSQAQVLTEIEKMTEEELVQNSPEYRNLIADGLSHEEAKARLQDAAGNLAFGYSALFAGVSSRLTGGGEFSANLFNPASRVGKTLSNLAATAQGAAKEALEETGASGGSQVATNIAKQQTVDETQDLTEGVGEAAATGAVAAAVSGGASGVAANTAASIIEATGSVTDKAKAAKQNRTTKKEIEENGTESVTTDVNDPNFSIGGTLRGIVSRNNVEGVTQEEKVQNYEAAVKVWTDYAEQIATLEEAANAAEGEQATQFQKRADALRTEGRRYSNIMSQLQKAQLETNNIEEATQQVVAGDTGATERVIGSILIDPESLKDEQAEALLGSTNLTEEQRTVVTAARDFNRLNKSIGEVSKDVFEGSPGYRGLNEYQEIISNAIEGGNEAAVQRYVTDLDNFVAQRQNKAAVARQALNTTDDAERAQLLRSIDLKTEGIAPSLVNQIEQEAEAATALQTMLNGLREVQNGTVETPAVDTTDSAAAPVETEVETPAAVETETTIEPEVTVDEAPTSDVTTTADVEPISETVEQAEVTEPTPKLAERLTTRTAEPTTEERSPEQADKAFAETNVVREKFVSTVAEEGLTNSPLQVEPNAVETLSADVNKAVEYLDQDTLTEEQSRAIGSFTEFAKAVSAEFDEAVAGDYAPADYMLYLRNDDGSFDENVKASVALAMYNWMAHKAPETTFNSQEDINNIVGRQEEQYVSPELRDLLQNVGTHQSNIIDELGSAIVRTLGIKAGPDAGSNAQTNLETSLGLFGLDMLRGNGLIQLNKVNQKELARIVDGLDDTNTAKDIDENREIFFYSMVDTDNARSFGEDTSGSNDVLGRLFKTETFRRGPTTEKPTQTVTRQKGTRQSVAKKVQDILLKHSQREHFVKKNQQKLFSQMTDEQIGRMMGLKDPATVQQHQRAGVEGKNGQIMNSVKYWREFHESLENEEQPFYFNWEQWKNQRVGIVSNTVNPQGDKLHRHLLYVGDQRQSISMDNTDLFLVGIAQGFGVSIDKQTDQMSRDELEELVQTPVFNEGIQETIKMLEDKPFDMDKILATVDKAGEAAHSMDALVAYSEYMLALRQGRTEFETDYSIEGDGITNGPAIASLQFAIGASDDNVGERLKRVGINLDGDTQQFGDWKSSDPLNDDNYQAIARDVVKRIDNLNERDAALLNTVMGELTAALSGTDREVVTKAGRNLTKNPLMTAIYGSGEKAITKAMGHMLLDKVYDYVGDSKRTEQDLRNLGSMLQLTKTQTNELVKNPLDFKLPYRRENDIVNFGSEVYGEAVFNAIQDNYSEFMARRTKVNDMMKVVFDLYAQQRDILIEKKTQEAIEKGLISGKRETLPLRMMREVEQELAQAQPVIHSYFSAQSGNLNEAIFVGKTENIPMETSQFRTEAKRKGKYAIDGAKTRNAFGRVTTPVDGGVSPTVLSVQGTDAATMLLTLENAGVLNVHDAIFTGTANGLTDMEAINRNFNQVMNDYSIVAQANESLQRALEAARKFDEENGTNVLNSEQTARSLMVVNEEATRYGIDRVKASNLTDADKGWENFLASINDTVTDTEEGRNSLLPRITYMSQYYMENGGYVTGNKGAEPKTISYEEAYGKIHRGMTGNKGRMDIVVDRLMHRYTEQGGERATAFANALANFKTEYRAGTVKNALEVFEPTQLEFVVSRLNDTYAAKPEPKSVSTENQENIYPVDEGIKEFLASGSKTSVETVAFLKKHSKDRAIRQTLLSLGDLLPRDYTVELFDADKHSKYSGSMVNSRGLHVAKEKLILIAGDEYAVNGLSDETITHELVHAALVERMKDSKNPEVNKAKNDLANIRKELAKNHRDTFKANSIDNIDEMIAWTLTSKQMQNALAQTQITYENKVKSAYAWVKGAILEMFGITDAKKGNALEKVMTAVQVIDAELSADDILFSASAARFNTRDFARENTQKVSQDNLVQTFDQMDNLGNKTEAPSHREHLRDLLGKLVGPVMTPINLHLADTLGNTYGAIRGDDVYIYTRMVDSVATPSGVAAFHGSKMSAQETFTHEMTHSVLRAAIDGNSRAKRELMKLFRYVKQNKLVTVEDLMDNPQNGVNSEDYKRAKDTWNYVMNIRTTAQASGRSNYLQEFAAYALTSEKFMNALSRTQVPKNVFSKDLFVEGDWVQTLRNIFDTALNWVNGHLSGLTSDMTVTEGVQKLALELAGVESANKHKLVQYADAAVNVVANKLGEFTNETRETAAEMGNKSFLKNNRFKVVRTASNVLRWSYDGVFGFMEYLAQTKLHSKGGRQTFLGSLLTEAMSRTDSTARFHDLSRQMNKLLDHDRKQIETNTAKALNGSFKRKLNSEEKVAITKAGIKTDLATLWDYLDMNQIEAVLDSPVELEKEISRTLGLLGSSRNRGFYYRASQALGYYMATGNVYEAHTLLNAENIAKMLGVTTTPADWENHVGTIDKLASLYAIKHTAPEHKATLVQLIRENEHSVGYVLDMHKQMQEEDRATLFDGDGSKFIKGYTRDLVDNNISVVQVNSAERAEYEKQGYQVVRELEQDTHIIGSEPVYLMVNKYGGANAYMAGIISLTSRKAKGSAQTEFDPMDIKGSKQQDIAEMRQAKRVDPTTKRGGQLLPNINADGTINSYRYVMNEETKDTLLAKHNHFDDVMGAMAAYSLDKRTTPEVNRQVIDALYEEYDATNAEAYIEVSAKSEDPVLKEYWATLPPDAKAYARDVWGVSRMYVRRDLAPIVFGNRKLSAADLLDREKAQTSWVREALVQFADHVLGPKAAGTIRKAEDIWKEFVKETKEFVVVKSGVVTLMNALSNTSQLFLEGMSIGDVLKWQKEAYVEARRYRRHAAELFELEKIVELGYEPANLDKNQERMAELRHELATSPVGSLIEDGMLQSIVEDVELADDTFSHKSQLTQKVEALTTRLPGFIRNGAKVVYMSHDTKLFKIMNEAAQLSDFVSRYALYKHKTENDGMSRRDAAGLVMDVFINYDMPTTPLLQYLNDMGVLWFTKYYFRIQKQIIRNFRENSARNIIFNVLNAMTGGAIPSVIDSLLSLDTLAARVRLPDNPLEMISNALLLRPFTN